MKGLRLIHSSKRTVLFAGALLALGLAGAWVTAGAKAWNPDKFTTGGLAANESQPLHRVQPDLRQELVRDLPHSALPPARTVLLAFAGSKRQAGSHVDGLRRTALFTYFPLFRRPPPAIA
jgi:hypothetical protein